MAAEDLSQLLLTYTHGLLLSGRQWRRLANAHAEAHGVSEAKALPLVQIGRLGGEPRQNILAEAVGIEGPSLVRLLDQLETAGLVVRKEDPTDRRAKILSLTATGRSVVAGIEADLDRLRKAVFSKVSAADLEASLRVFQAVQDHVDRPSEFRASRDKVAHDEAAE
ncbi:MarR family winged helix-turn-helix transcriptional regulator [Methylorubrum podarium]|jgi:MarR family transcriptional regulator, transcriptional regulator for hemolysin|uniref:MarR family winged helix-turn-helix transcriptional regulator n=1 Tax=Methylorubrum podarium TaxID=200476 RepID=UPI001EE2A2F0|nr:MarR family transcriptional regulator [Methylorubrum podarium]GJE73222.1 Transcriptional regulator SlyA [Methylorubrum podarium]